MLSHADFMADYIAFNDIFLSKMRTYIRIDTLILVTSRLIFPRDILITYKPENYIMVSLLNDILWIGYFMMFFRLDIHMQFKACPSQNTCLYGIYTIFNLHTGVFVCDGSIYFESSYNWIDLRYVYGIVFFVKVMLVTKTDRTLY